MALPTNIHTLLSGTVVEWARLDFKAGWNPQVVLHSICAFANDIDNWGGGYIILGVEDENGRPKRPLKGLNTNEIDGIQKDLLEKCKLLVPSYLPIVEPVMVDGAHLLIVWVPGGTNRPYKCPISLTGKQGSAYYIRKMASTIVATPEEERELIVYANNVPFDDRMNHQAEIADLKLPIIQSFLHEVKSDLYPVSADMDFTRLCQSMMIVDGTPEYMKPRNVGLLFFNDRPQAFFPLSQIEVVTMPYGPAGEGMTERIFAGPIHQLLRDALTYLRNTVIQERVRKVRNQAEAVRTMNYPFEAIEEALVNAIYHRSYEIREPVEVRILPDRIEILSYPGPDRSISLEALKTYRVIGRRYRNRRIGDFLKELRLTEGRSTGIPTIVNALTKNGSPNPIFETDEERSFFLTILPMHPDFLTPIDTFGGINGGMDGGINLSEQERTVIDLLSVKPESTQEELAARSGYSLRTIQRIIYGLKGKGIIHREGSNKEGRWGIA